MEGQLPRSIHPPSAIRAAPSPWLRHGEDQFVALRPHFGAGKPCAMLPSRTRTEIVNIHASCVAAGNGGVLILGNSGQGKSDLALRLIDRGARLVADDRCDTWFERGRPGCRPPENPAGTLEGPGIAAIAHSGRATCREKGVQKG